MRQVLHNLKSGELYLEDIPCPMLSPGHLLIETTTSLISAGTERMLIEFGKAGYLSKARQKPDKVKQVINKIKTDGLAPTIDAVFSKLDTPIPLGYSNAGRVLEVGNGVEGFSPGDRVFSNGRHAEIVCVPVNLCQKIPDGVDDESATFTAVGSIALQGIRLIAPTLGESVAVFGLGLIGLMAVQLLRANGVRVIGFDYEPDRVKIAKSYGAIGVDLSTGADPVKQALKFSDGRGVDASLITASTTSDAPVKQSAQMCRKRGRIVLTGVAGLNIDRADFYEKEISFQVSCSYGPGRYDPEYEERGNDYPVGFVRWTVRRNFEAVLGLMADSRLTVESLISQRHAFANANKAYQYLESKGPIGIILRYPAAEKDASEATTRRARIIEKGEDISRPSGAPVVGLVGAGGFATRRMLPALKDAGVRLKTVASATGLSAAVVAKKFAFEKVVSDSDIIFSDDEINAVFIATRHGSHAGYVIEGLKNGKSVFVEKPLCITIEELDEIEGLYTELEQSGKSPHLMVGFNRRFSPLTKIIQSQIAGRSSPLAMTFVCNAGYIPPDHWTQDPVEGGGRIIGEACHFIDYLRHLAGSPIVSVRSVAQPTQGGGTEDTVSMTLEFEDGSIGTVHYFSNGPKSYPKERLDLFVEGKALTLDNFTKVTGYGCGRFSRKRLLSQDKGHRAGFLAFADTLIKGEPAPIPFGEIINVTRATIAAVTSIRSGETVRL